MALQSSGSISLSEIQTEFGGSNPISISEYYAGGANVPSGTTGDGGAIPTSGEISIGDFYGASNRVAIILTISANTNGYNIFNNRGGTYVAGGSDVTLVNNANIYSTSGVALDTGTGWTAGDTITIDNNALIVGHGGDGGAGGNATNQLGLNASNGGAGSTAFNLQYSITLDNTGGTISGGSGGGGGGGGASCASAAKGSTIYNPCGGGGGGAGRASASGGAGGVATFSGSGNAANGSAGGSSSITASGSGGSGGQQSSNDCSLVTGGTGGAGGSTSAGAGANGNNGSVQSGGSTGSGGTGGAGGKAINLNGNSITYTATGTIHGAVS